jgi:hypothetical protein
VKLRQLHQEVAAGITSSATDAIGDALDDLLAAGLNGRSARMVELNRDTVKPLRPYLDDVKLQDLSAGDVQEALDELASDLSTRSLQIIRNCLERAIRHAEIRDLVGRIVAALIKAPKGRSGRPCTSLTPLATLRLRRAGGYNWSVRSTTSGAP